MLVRVRSIHERSRDLLRLRVPQVDDRDVELLAERSRHVVLAELPELDEPLPESTGSRALGGVLDRRAVDDPAVDEEVADAWARLVQQRIGDQESSRRHGDRVGFAPPPHVVAPKFVSASVRLVLNATESPVPAAPPRGHSGIRRCLPTPIRAAGEDGREKLVKRRQRVRTAPAGRITVHFARNMDEGGERYHPLSPKWVIRYAVFVHCAQLARITESRKKVELKLRG